MGEEVVGVAFHAWADYFIESERADYSRAATCRCSLMRAVNRIRLIYAGAWQCVPCRVVDDRSQARPIGLHVLWGLSPIALKILER